MFLNDNDIHLIFASSYVCGTLISDFFFLNRENLMYRIANAHAVLEVKNFDVYRNLTCKNSYRGLSCTNSKQTYFVMKDNIQV